MASLTLRAIEAVLSGVAGVLVRKGVNRSNGWTLNFDTLDMPQARAAWLQLLYHFDLVDRPFEGRDVAVTAADHLPNDLRAVPAYADIHSIIALAAVSGVSCFEPEMGSAFPILIAEAIKIGFQQHPILGRVAAFSKSVLWGAKSRIEHQSLMNALKHANGEIEIQPDRMFASPLEKMAFSAYVGLLVLLEYTGDEIRAGLHRCRATE